MIQRISEKYAKPVALALLLTFSGEMMMPLYAASRRELNYYRGVGATMTAGVRKEVRATVGNNKQRTATASLRGGELIVDAVEGPVSEKKVDIGGPSQPEMLGFKPAGANDMVNTFTGDFSYNIPLLDVGGYPVNIFYTGGITPEQEAGWVGLGWNINPGTVSRNVRGVPDDFDGTEKIIQEQNIKPNVTWGGRFGADVEFVGIKDMLGINLGVGLGASFNNYLGPALDVGFKGGVSLKIMDLSTNEKRPSDSLGLRIGVGIDANMNSRNGLTINPNISLSARLGFSGANFGAGLGASTSYNSRTGIKSLQLSEQGSFNYYSAKLLSEKSALINSSSVGTRNGVTISFAKPSYTPAMRMPISNSAQSGHFQIGAGMTGISGSVEIEVYKQESELAQADRIQYKPMIGYLYAHKAQSNRDAVMDFSRFGDREVTAKTPVIAVPQYAYDVFSISGEGTGGMMRAYRNDHGYVRDNTVKSKDKSISAGVDVGIPGHIGANFNLIKTPSTSGEWEQGNRLRSALPFKENDKLNEQVYFRNPGENSVMDDDRYSRIGDADLVRFKLGGTKANATIEPVLERFDEAQRPITSINMTSVSDAAARQKRSQVMNVLTAKEAQDVGLEHVLRNYNITTVVEADTLKYASLSRINVSEGRQPHHISEIDVTEADGRKYVYGLPVYNLDQREYTFTTSGTPDQHDLVDVNAGETNVNVAFPDNRDGYILNTRTPAYAHSYLLTGLLSPDYVDVTGNGITEDDQGSAVKFNYVKTGTYKWRTPYVPNGQAIAHFNSGNLTETKDDKALITYGERESWYVHSIESKTMIALFTLEDRKDGKGVSGVMQGINTSDASVKRLKKIDLYNKADIKKNGLANAKPIKTVWFEYDYSLCAGAPGNTGAAENVGSVDANANKGKLTLKGIYFTYNGQAQNNRGKRNRYVFNYGNNPNYTPASTDRWGNFKPRAHNPADEGGVTGLKNSIYPYALQGYASFNNANAAAWMLNKVLLPSGGQIEVEYEADDYAFVQERRATVMMPITHTGREAANTGNRLYDVNSFGSVDDNDKIYVTVAQPCVNKQDVYDKYLTGLRQLAFKLAVKMPKGKEYLTMYANIQDYGVGQNANEIWIKLRKVDGYGPLSLTAIEYLREHLPGQAFAGYEPQGNSLQQFGDMLSGMVDGMKGAFKNPVNFLREQKKAQEIVLQESFVRLNEPVGKKNGGGHRVKSVVIKDNWNAMTGQYTSRYGQQYDYTTTEMFNGQARTISSGVASYEPSIGGEENPYQEILQLSDRLPLGPANYEAIEMPVLDAFFPAPVVGYSKVTTRSIKSGDTKYGKKSRSGIGHQVTEYYTAKDYPVRHRYTSLDPESDRQKHDASMMAFFKKWSFDSRAISQGFLVETNDMHGKIKSQSSYAETDPNTRMSYTEYFYRNTGKNGLGEKFDFVHNELGGVIKPGSMGIDVELMTDVREFTVKSSSLAVQAQVDWMIPAPLPVWLPFIWPVFGTSESIYRAVTTTKLVNYHSVVDSVVVMDKGSVVSTRNLVFDANTGTPVVTRTNNEFDKPIYNTTYPAYWAYSGMGLAYKNIDARLSGIQFTDGKITGGLAPQTPKDYFESGDEIYIISGASPSDPCWAALQSSDGIKRIWAYDRNKNNSSLTNTTPDLVFIDAAGKPYTKANVTLRIIRSGKRNMLTTPAASITSLENPEVETAGVRKLLPGSTTKVLNASAVEYKEKWQVDPDVIRRVATNMCTGLTSFVCLGQQLETVNPYVKGLLGTFRPHRNMVFYGERTEGQTSVTSGTKLSANGTLLNFAPYWQFNAQNNLVTIPESRWVWNSEITRVNSRGLELETKDALNIYTAAQYGYRKSLPVAIANNARYDQILYQSYEDVGYNESLNSVAVTPCSELELLPLNGQVVNADAEGINAHTGNNFFRLDAGQNSALGFYQIAANTANYAYNILANETDITKSLIDPGVNLNGFDPCVTNDKPYSASVLARNIGNGDYGLQLTVGQDYSIPPSSFPPYHGFRVNASQYLDVQGPTELTFNIIAAYDTYQWYQGWNLPYVNIKVKDLNGSTLFSYQSSYIFNAQPAVVSPSFELCKGRYLVEYLMIRPGYTPVCFPTITPPNGDAAAYPSSHGHTSVLGYQTQVTVDIVPTSSLVNYAGYRTLTTINGCEFTKPIPGKEEMKNDLFRIPENTRMLLSGWVREECNTPCTKSTYSDAKFRLVYFDETGAELPSPQIITAAGPIVEGWQRVEAEFTAPSNAKAVRVDMMKTGTGKGYFDDIRIHPFPANMKSYVYDPVNMRLLAELDANNYAVFYEYDEEGGLIRTKAETAEGVKTIKETRSARQKDITTFQ